MDDICGDTLAILLVSDIHKFKRINSGKGTVFGVKSDGAMIVQVAASYTDTMQFGAQNLDHALPLKKGPYNGPA